MKKLGTGAVAATLTTLYTVPTGYRTEVQDICLANTTAGSLTCALYLVPTGGSASTGNMMFPTVTIPGNTLVHWSGVQILNAGDFIQAIGSATGITAHISGNEGRAGT